jgi:hypothetical protein
MDPPPSMVWTSTLRPLVLPAMPNGVTQTVFARVGIDGDGCVDKDAAAPVDLDGLGGHSVGLLMIVGAGLHQCDQVVDGHKRVSVSVFLADLGDGDPVEHSANDVEFLVDDFRMCCEEPSGDLHVVNCPSKPGR